MIVRVTYIFNMSDTTEKPKEEYINIRVRSVGGGSFLFDRSLIFLIFHRGSLLQD